MKINEQAMRRIEHALGQAIRREEQGDMAMANFCLTRALQVEKDARDMAHWESLNKI